MPHARERLALPRLEKKLRFFPVVAIQGARQTGKSFLARELLKSRLKACEYQTFDHQSIKNEAERAPHTFLLEHSQNRLLIIDEAQKVPEIFDAIKFEVDQKRTPGQYLLLGSTEFSKLTQIRESLTGRMGRIRLFPMTVAETRKSDGAASMGRREVLHYLKNGGMPGIFSVRDIEEQDALFQDWIDLTCLRDIQQFKGLKLDGDLSYELLKLSATLDEPSRAQMAKATRVDPRKVETHLKALCALFVLQRLNPHPTGTGKPIYLPLDCGVARYLGASQSRLLHVWLTVERMAANAYSQEKKKTFWYYRSTGKRTIHLVEESIGAPLRGFQVLTHERILKTDAELMAAFLKKNPGAHGVALAPIPAKQKIKTVSFLPWEALGTAVNFQSSHSAKKSESSAP